MKKQGFLYGSAVLIFSALLTKLAGALFRVPLANLLGGTGMGYFSGAYGIFMTVYAVSVTGLPAAVAKVTAENSALERYGNLRGIKSTAVAFFAVMGLAFTAAMLLLARPFCVYVNDSPETVPAVLAIAPSVFFGCVTAVYRGYYEGLRNMYPTAVSQILEGLVKLCGGLALCLWVLKNPDKTAFLRDFFHCSPTALAAAAAVFGISLSSAVGTFFLIARDKVSGDGLTREEIISTSGANHTDSRRKIVSDLLKTAVPIALGALVTNLTSLIDLVTIMRALKSAAKKAPAVFAEIAPNVPAAELPAFLFGSFTGLAVTVFNLVPSFTNMFGKGVLPALSEAFAERDGKRVRTSAEKALFVTALVSFPSAAGISALSGEILQTLFPTKPTETAACTASLAILGIAVAFLCVSSTAFAILQAAGRPDLPVKLMLPGVLVKFVGNILLVPIPELNITGAAISTLLCYAVICLPAVALAKKYTKLDNNYIKGIFCKIVYCSIMCGGGALLAKITLAKMFGGIILLFFSIIFGVIFYIIST
ncbi:MAG: polysaccharide biosynthesis protein, partial [Ruminococcus sp.]|nr:polysaccharide biosynthesis protein [Ruminococcus sp.]